LSNAFYFPTISAKKTVDFYHEQAEKYSQFHRSRDRPQEIPQYENRPERRLFAVPGKIDR
jgi:hypothetical protein